MELHKPNFITDGGPWAEHDQACAVCQDRHAVILLNKGMFQPCWECQKQGWHTVRFNGAFRRLLKRFFIAWNGPKD